MLKTFAPSDLPDNCELTLRLSPTQANTNAGGNIFGGWLMSQVDIAASIIAYERARMPVVTRAVNSFQFIKPVFVGDLVSCYGHIIHEGHSSMTIHELVYTQRGNTPDLHIKVAEAELVFVAINHNHKPTPYR